MIVGRLAHWRERLAGSAAWRTAFEALERLDGSAPEGETRLDGDDVYLRVMSYATLAADAEGTHLEAHRRYVDIQMTLEGGERIDWFPVETLDPKAPYDEARDVQWLRWPGPAPASVDVLPGTFVVLFPEDAHMPKLATGRGDAWVKKVVVKVRLSKIQ
jgi:YhcH/YjgK/YiaL family protein